MIEMSDRNGKTCLEKDLFTATINIYSGASWRGWGVRKHWSPSPFLLPLGLFEPCAGIFQTTQVHKSMNNYCPASYPEAMAATGGLAPNPSQLTPLCTPVIMPQAPVNGFDRLLTIIFSRRNHAQVHNEDSTPPRRCALQVCQCVYWVKRIEQGEYLLFTF